jgi:hypothetical protein
MLGMMMVWKTRGASKQASSIDVTGFKLWAQQMWLG